MSHEILENTKPVTISFKGISVEDVIRICLSFQDLKLTYAKIGNTISVMRDMKVPTPSLLSTYPPALFGIVRSDDGKPMAGATVEIIPVNKKVLTNEKGEFSFSRIPDGKYKVEITFIGYEKYQTIIEIGTNPIQLTADLKTSSSSLDQVQVIAYGTTSQRLATGDVSTISGKDIERQPVGNALMALEGRVPGLFISQSNGLPGGGVTALIQGQSSMANGNDPFYVVDGVPYTSELLSNMGNILGRSGGFATGSPLSYINPTDIENISILKDADATAIYGSRAANGAILITTKKGKSGKSKLDINTQIGWERITRKLNLLETKEYLQMRHEAKFNDNESINSTDYDINGFWDTTQNTDWQKSLIGGTGNYVNTNATISGGNSSTQYLLSGTYRKEKSVFPGNFSDVKGAVHFNLSNASADQRFKLQFSLNYLLDNNKLPSIDLTSVAGTLAPDGPNLYNQDGTINWMQNSSGKSTWTNPLSYLYNKYNNKANNLIANVILSYLIIPGLEFKVNFGYNNFQSNEVSTSALLALKPERRPTLLNAGVYGNSTITSWIIEPQVSYRKLVGKAKVDLLLGSSINQSSDNLQQLVGTGYSSDLLLEDIKSAANLNVQSTIASQYKYVGVFGKLNSNWMDKYLLDLTIRRDGSSRFGVNNQYHNFNAVGAGWIFSKEAFMDNFSKCLSFGKLRFSYGTTGNDQIGNYTFLNLYSPINAGVAYQGATGLIPGGLSNPYLEWEETRKLQYGLDLGFINDRILLHINYFNNRSSNQLLYYAVPVQTGFGSLPENLPATVQNSGFEISLNSINLRFKNFKWSSNITLTIPRNKLISFPNLASSSYSSVYIVGQSISFIKAFHFAGVNKSTGIYEFSDGHGGLTNTPDTNFSNSANVLINTLPRFYGGLQNSFSYKGIEIDILLQFVKQTQANYLFGALLPGRALINQPATVRGRWKQNGDVSSIQKYNSNLNLLDSYFDAVASDKAYSDASYIRVKNVSISWQLPEKMTGKVFKEVRIFTAIQNWLTITSFKGPDPETLSTLTLPPMRTVTLGLHLGM